MVRNFAEGEKIRIFVQFGPKEEEWKDATVLDANFDEVLAECKGKRFWLDRHKVKHLKKFKYDMESQCWPEVRKFENDRWERLKKEVSRAMKALFPKKEINFDDKEKIINVESFYVGADIEERETFDSFMDVPVWSITAEVYCGGSYSEPPSTDVVNLSFSASEIGAARGLIEALYKSEVEGYFDSIPWEFEEEDIN